MESPGIIVDDTLFGPDIDSIKTIRVVIATDENGKQGIMTLHTRDGDVISNTPCVWADDKRDKQHRELIDHMKIHNPRIRVEIREFVLKE